MLGTSTKKNFTKDQLINLLNNKIKRTQPQYRQQFNTLLNKLRAGQNLNNRELTQLTLTSNGTMLKGGSKK